MTTLRVLVYGTFDAGVTDALRLGVFREPLGALGVELRSWTEFADDVLNGGSGAGGPTEPAARPDAEALRAAGLSALAWSDVVLFRRWRSTQAVCTECDAPFTREAALAAHVRQSGHQTLVPDPLLRPIVDLLVGHPGLRGGRAIVYDTDDDVLEYPEWTGFGPAARRERDLIERILALADLVTTTTPVLAARLAGHTRAAVRVVRNALNPAWYATATPEPGLAGDPRLLYHGVPARLRDYAVAQPAIETIAREVPALRRVWLGASHEPRVVAAMDEVRPWVAGLPEFAAALVAARPDIGLAPLLDEPFNRAKSELHWLEYALAGAPTVVTGFDGPGPYDVVRDGRDGLVARTPADWARHLRALVGSPALRADLAGRARERVLVEYDVADRALEWADAYRWAADHAGAGRASSPNPSPPIPAPTDIRSAGGMDAAK